MEMKNTTVYNQYSPTLCILAQHIIDNKPIDHLQILLTGIGDKYISDKIAVVILNYEEKVALGVYNNMLMSMLHNSLNVAFIKHYLKHRFKNLMMNVITRVSLAESIMEGSQILYYASIGMLERAIVNESKEDDFSVYDILEEFENVNDTADIDQLYSIIDKELVQGFFIPKAMEIVNDLHDFVINIDDHIPEIYA